MSEFEIPLYEDTPLQDDGACAYHVLRYSPYPVRDEWVNIGVLVFNPETGEHRLRLIQEQEEFARIRRLHPNADEAVLRALRDDLEDRLRTAAVSGSVTLSSPELISKWSETLSNALQLGPQKGLLGTDLDSALERVYTDQVAIQRGTARIGISNSRATMRGYCGQVFRQAQLWSRIQKAVSVDEYTFPGDPMRLDYSYLRNGTRGFIQTLSVTRAPGDAKLLAYTVEKIQKKARLKTEFTAVTDIPLKTNNERHMFVNKILRDVHIEPVPLEGFAVWVPKLKALMQ
jgi:hypothetical protein